MFDDLPRNHFGAILADPPWRFRTWKESNKGRSALRHYDLMETRDIMQCPVERVAADDCVLFMWVSWPMMVQALNVISAWGFTYKTVAFDWTKANMREIDMFRDDADALMGTGYWTRANSEPCVLATRGRPKRRSASVRMGIIEPRREHSRKPDCVYERIERLVAGPYLELFARQTRPGWTSWGNEVGKFDRKVG